MKTIGWLADTPIGYRGGAELASEWLMCSAPSWAQVVPMPPGSVSDDVDGFVVQNCVQYQYGHTEILQRRPVLKQIHDMWPDGDHRLRAWLLHNAAGVICSGPMHRRRLGERWTMPESCVYELPPVGDLTPFRAVRDNPARGFGAVWLGRFEYGKEVNAAVEWCKAHGLPLDVYGYGSRAAEIDPYARQCGKLDPEAVPGVLSRYRTFVFLPSVIEPFGRVVAEAWAAGCEIVTNENVGAAHWIHTSPDTLDRAAAEWWAVAAKVFA